MNPRVRPRDKFELSLDGRQVASIVVGALVVLAVVFVLGLNVGKQLALRQMEVRRPGDLDALDRAPAASAGKPQPLTFHDRLTKEAPPQPPAPEAAPPPPSAVAGAPSTGAPGAAPAPAAAPTPAPPAAAPTPAAPAAAPAPPPTPADVTSSPAPKAWTVQLAAAGDRGEAERFARRFAALRPRIEETVVPGKGRFFRVRVGSFDTKEAAQRYLRDAARETGAKGIVVPSR